MLTAIRNLIRTLTLPSNAGVTSPRVVIGPDIPPELVAYYGSYNTTAGITFQVVAVILGYDGTGAYSYRAYLKGLTGEFGPGWAEGEVTAALVVRELSLVMSLPPVFVQYGYNTAAQIIIGNVSGLTAQAFGDTSLELNQLADFVIDGVSAGRGLKAWVASTANSAAVGAEAVVLTLPTMVFRSGRVYRVDVDAALLGSVANVGLYQLRQTNLAGTILAQWQHQNPFGGGPQMRFTDRIYIARNSSQADRTDNVVITLTASAGTVTQIGALLEVRSAAVYDIGAFGDYPNIKQI